MPSTKIKSRIQNNFNTVLIGSIVFGIFCPGLDRIPVNSVIVVMTAIIFLACTKIDRKDFAIVSPREVFLFYIVRFIALPLLLFYVTNPFAPKFAYAVLLMALMPAGVSSAALAHMFGGSVSLALSITVLSTALTPIVVPVFFEILSDTSVKIDAIGMFQTLSILIFIPIIFDRLFDTVAPEKRLAVRENSGWLSVVLIGLMVVLIVGKYQNEFFQDPILALTCLTLLSIEFAIFYGLGWMFVRDNSFTKKVSYAICSGANNCGLAAALAFLYLSPISGIYSVLSEIPWVLALIPFKKYVSSREGA